MNIDSTALFLSLIPSGLGFVLLVYGKKQQRWPHIVAGLAFMVYPYIASSTAAMVGIGTLIGAGLWAAIRLGW